MLLDLVRTLILRDLVDRLRTSKGQFHLIQGVDLAAGSAG